MPAGCPAGAVEPAYPARKPLLHVTQGSERECDKAESQAPESPQQYVRAAGRAACTLWPRALPSYRADPLRNAAVGTRHDPRHSRAEVRLGLARQPRHWSRDGSCGVRSSAPRARPLRRPLHELHSSGPCRWRSASLPPFEVTRTGTGVRATRAGLSPSPPPLTDTSCPQGEGEVVAAAQGVGVVGSQDAFAGGEGVAVQVGGVLVPAEPVQGVGEVAPTGTARREGYEFSE